MPLQAKFARMKAVTVGKIFPVKHKFPSLRRTSQSRQDRSNYSAMASDHYSRYVPPKNTKKAFQAPSVSTLPASRGTSPVLQHTPLEHTSFQQRSHQQPPHRPTPQPSTNSEKRKHENDDHLLEDQPRPKKRKGKDDISRHKALLLKREKSAKKSEKLVSLLF